MIDGVGYEAFNTSGGLGTLTETISGSDESWFATASMPLSDQREADARPEHLFA